jgi:hypothetical protein
MSGVSVLRNPKKRSKSGRGGLSSTFSSVLSQKPSSAPSLFAAFAQAEVQRHETLRLLQFDRAVSLRINLLLVNVFLSLAAVITWFQTLKEAKFKGSIAIEVDESVIRVVIAILTALLLGQIVEYYAHQIRFENQPWFQVDSFVWYESRDFFFFFFSNDFLIFIHQLSLGKSTGGGFWRWS